MSSHSKDVLVRVVFSDQPQRLHQTLDQEFYGCWFESPESDTTIISKMFPLDDIPDSPTMITQLLRKYRGYKDKDNLERRWACIPKRCRLESELYTPYVKIIQDIVKMKGSKGKTTYDTTSRKIVDTHATEMPHLFEVGREMKSNPDISLFGTGPSICKETLIMEPSYAQLLSPVEIKLNGQLMTSRDRLQLATYAREIFVQQQNRKFVFGVLLTETNVQVYRFDRSGSFCSPWLNIHTHPELFVRIILGITSGDEASLGYDTSISWDHTNMSSRWIEVRPNRIVKEREGEQPTVEDYEGAPLRFKILDPNGQAIYSRNAILGRSTTCWLVEHDKDGKHYLIKDCWRAEGLQTESTFLERAVGLKRVGQIYAYQNSIYTTSCSASTLSVSELGYPIPRKLDRTVSQVYGGDLSTCESVDELVDAVRDIAIALLELLEKGIIHRDISFGNALRGAFGSPIKGFLIDLDMAADMQKLIETSTENNSRIGTRMFQSIKILHGNLRHHDHMDDLESVFYLLCWICYGMDAPGGAFLKPVPESLSCWDDADGPRMCAIAKHDFLSRRLMPPSRAFRCLVPLLEDMRQLFLQRVSIVEDERYALKWKSQREAPPPNLKKLPPYSLDIAHVDHKKFLEIIDKWKRTRGYPDHTELELPANDTLSNDVKGLDTVSDHTHGTSNDGSSDSRHPSCPDFSTLGNASSRPSQDLDHVQHLDILDDFIAPREPGKWSSSSRGTKRKHSQYDDEPNDSSKCKKRATQ